MKPTTAALALLGLPAAWAFPQLAARQNGDFTTWAAAGADDARSPCPALNALANHDILPHSGRGITLELLTAAFAQLNLGADLATGLFTAAVSKGLTSDSALDLDSLREHNAIEHDGSLSRADYALDAGDNYSLNATNYAQWLSWYEGSEVATPELAGKARMDRLQTEKARDPTFTYGLTQQLASNAETAIFLGVLGDPEEGVAPMSYVRVLFEEERFPYNEGWRPSSETIDTVGLIKLMVKTTLASGEALQDIGLITFWSLHEVLSALHGHW